MRINTNILSRNTQSSLNRSQSSLGAAIERLSSGLRINRAADDAARLSIANRMESRIRGKDQALRNLNDGISMLKTVDSGLSSITDSVQRIRELAVQKANDTNSVADKQAIQQEIDERLADITRLGETINFNGKTLGIQNSVQSLQIGEGAGDSLDINLKALNLQTLGLDTTRPPIGPAISPENPLVYPPGTVYKKTGEDISGSWGNISAIQVLANQHSEESGAWWSTLYNAENKLNTEISVHPILDADGNYDPTKGVAIKVGDTYYSAFLENALHTNFDSATNSFSVQIEMSFGLVRPNFHRVADIYDVATGQTIAVSFDQQQVGFDEQGNFVDYVVYTDQKGQEYYISYADRKKGMTINSASGENLSPHAVHLATTNYIDAADDALKKIGEYQSYIGAMMNRMESVGNGLEDGANDLRAAQSRIQDADYAAEISNMTRSQILQQAGQAVLAQANQIPQGILSLLR